MGFSSSQIIRLCRWKKWNEDPAMRWWFNERVDLTFFVCDALQMMAARTLLLMCPSWIVWRTSAGYRYLTIIITIAHNNNNTIASWRPNKALYSWAVIILNYYGTHLDRQRRGFCVVLAWIFLWEPYVGIQKSPTLGVLLSGFEDSLSNPKKHRKSCPSVRPENPPLGGSPPE